MSNELISIVELSSGSANDAQNLKGIFDEAGISSTVIKVDGLKDIWGVVFSKGKGISPDVFENIISNTDFAEADTKFQFELI